jgi:hypothetical protein
MRQTALLPFRRKACWGFFARKIRRLQLGANQRSWVPGASMLTTRPPKPLTYPYSELERAWKEPAKGYFTAFSKHSFSRHTALLIMLPVDRTTRQRIEQLGNKLERTWNWPWYNICYYPTTLPDGLRETPPPPPKKKKIHEGGWYPGKDLNLEFGYSEGTNLTTLKLSQ